MEEGCGFENSYFTRKVIKKKKTPTCFLQRGWFISSLQKYLIYLLQSINKLSKGTFRIFSILSFFQFSLPDGISSAHRCWLCHVSVPGGPGHCVAAPKRDWLPHYHQWKYHLQVNERQEPPEIQWSAKTGYIHVWRHGIVQIVIQKCWECRKLRRKRIGFFGKRCIYKRNTKGDKKKDWANQQSYI